MRGPARLTRLPCRLRQPTRRNRPPLLPLPAQPPPLAFHVRREAGQQLAAACAPLVPYLLQAGAAMVCYTGGLAAAQAAGMALRVSCVTPVAGPVGGLLGVGLASAMAGQASIKCRQYLKDPK